MNALPADIPYHRLLPPAILLFGDDPHRRLIAAQMVVRGGGRIVANAPLAEAAARLDRPAGAQGLILDIRKDHGAALDALLARVAVLSEAAGRLFAIVIVPPALIDVVTARIDGLGACVMIEPGEEEFAAAIDVLTTPASPCVEEGRDASRRRLAELSEEVSRIARTLAALSADEPDNRVVAPRATASADAPLVRAFLRLRQLRGHFFMPELFADPAWDILLDLAAARIEGRLVAVSSLCIAAAVPATTALRWITQMTEQGLLVRRPDPTDGRRVFIGLSDRAAGGIDGYLSAARSVIAPVA